MKKLLYAFAVFGLISFAACNSQSEPETQVQEDTEIEDEMRDQAEERTDDMEDMEEELGDTSAVLEQ